MVLPHEVLGVAEDADEATINAAFRRAAKRFHPDLNNGDSSGIRKLRRLIWAREFLARHRRRFANARDRRLRLAGHQKPRSFRTLYFACAVAGPAILLTAPVLVAGWGVAKPNAVVVVEKTMKTETAQLSVELAERRTEMAELPDADAAEIKAIRDAREGSYAPAAGDMSLATEPQLQSAARHHRSTPGLALKKAINRAATRISRTFRRLSSAR